ncbi:MAG: ATPase domain-containing protein, partial [Halobacteria archaeon]|nr:ATPase domain-containing protein [Halobacteria archaeon]
MSDYESERKRVSIGVDGVDEVLHGGLVPRRSYMVRGSPGAGKTLLGMHFLTQGVNEGETSLFINMGEAQEDIVEDARKFGFDTSGVEFLDLSPSSEFFVEDQSYSIFASDEVEDGFTNEITERVGDIQPDRVFVDPLTQFRYLSSDDYQFRKQVLSFLRFLKEVEATLLFTSQDTEVTPDSDLQFMSDGIIHLEANGRRRSMRISKFRGSDYHNGSHSVRITGEGMEVFPELVPQDYDAEFDDETVSSGIDGLDRLLNGGIERGTVTIISGPSGAGKTTTGTQFMTEAAARGERSVIYMFEESKETFLHRSN